ncbi:MAG: hypothetical protein NC517_05460 [Firmicutes bacterium]|nr:hypothetical protein [Bacillota bacterium]
MKNEERIMALCDTEEEYAQLMTEFLKKNRELPWKLHTYTDAQELIKEEKKDLELLVVSESAYCEELRKIEALRTVVLSESGVMRWENVLYVDKYQQAEEVLKELIRIYMEIADTRLPKLKKSGSITFIGNYSPVRRALQTSFALTMGQLLAKDHPTLYLNFEHYGGIGELRPDIQTSDMADLLYFLHGDKEKFHLRLQSICKHMGDLDYIPPMKSGQNLLTITEAEWLELLQRIEETGEYEYVILDLSESMQGLFEILRMCKVVFTLTKEDRIARSKLLQYEQLLSLYEYGDVLEKTRRLRLPHIQRLPEELEQLTRGDLAALVNDLLKGV